MNTTTLSASGGNAAALRLVLALASGALFGLGLIAGGMANPLKVKAFLDLAGAWDPSLALVMGGAVAVGLLAFARARGRSKAWTGDNIDWPDMRHINARLVLGGVLFGIGWGIAGFCPGPALVALGSGFAPALIFVASMLAGMLLHDVLLERPAPPAQAPAQAPTPPTLKGMP